MIEPLESRTMLTGTLPGPEGFNLVDPSQYALTFGGFRKVRSTGFYSQAVTIKNNGWSAIGGPLSLEIQNLSITPFQPFGQGGGTFPALINASGDVGSPSTVYVNFDTPNEGGVLAPGQSATAVLQFHNLANAPITYSTAVKQGMTTAQQLKYVVDGSAVAVDATHPLQFGGGDGDTFHTLEIVNIGNAPVTLGFLDVGPIDMTSISDNFVPGTQDVMFDEETGEEIGLGTYTPLNPSASGTYTSFDEFYFLDLANHLSIALAPTKSVSFDFRIINAGNVGGTGASAGSVIFPTHVYVPGAFPNPEISLTMMKHGTLGNGTVIKNGALEVNFGIIPRGQNILPRNFQIRNVGTNGLKVTSTVFSKNTPQFAVTSQPKTSGGGVYTLGNSIAANDFVQFQISMDTSTAGAKAAFIEFSNNDFANPYDGNGAATRFRFKLIGTVTAAAAPVAAAPVNSNRPVVVSRPAQTLLRPVKRKPVWNDANGGA